MLDPEIRTLLFDVLRPPEGYALDAAVATTYTLNLLALLTAPVAFSLFETEDETGLLSRDSLALLESLRRYADKMTVFCEVGQIGVPAVQFPQLAYLEQVVVQCRKPHPGSAFHPKVWVMRFTAPDGPVRYRFTCLTRNLTFDRSWDTAVTLDGFVGEKRETRNEPLSRFLRALPNQAVASVTSAVSERVDLLASELDRVAFEIPEGFDDVRFHPMGIAGVTRSPIPSGTQPLLVISPFVSAAAIRRLSQGRSRVVLVTRQETLDTVDCAAPEIEKYYVMADAASPTDGDEVDSSAAMALHAKCYVVDDGARARVFTGSANATDAGLGSNVEFLVELIGPRARFGVDGVLAPRPDDTRLIDVLEEVSLPPPPTPDPVADGIRSTLEGVRDIVAEAGYRGRVEADGDTYRLELTCAAEVTWPEDVTARCWPVCLGKAWGTTVRSTMRFEELSFEHVSSFVAFEVTVEREGRQVTERFVLNVSVEGMPPDRRERLLKSVLRDPRSVMQYLRLLLADNGRELAQQMAVAHQTRHERNGALAPAEESALLESLLRTLRESPGRLDDIDRLVRDLTTGEREQGLLPPQFLEIWTPLWHARKESATW